MDGCKVNVYFRSQNYENMLHWCCVDGKCLTTQPSTTLWNISEAPTVYYTSQCNCATEWIEASFCVPLSYWSRGSKSPVKRPISGELTTAGLTENRSSADNLNLFPLYTGKQVSKPLKYKLKIFLFIVVKSLLLVKHQLSELI